MSFSQRICATKQFGLSCIQFLECGNQLLHAFDQCIQLNECAKTSGVYVVEKNYETFHNKVIFFTLRNYVCAQDTILDAKSPISGLFPPRFRLWTRKIMLKQSGMHNLSKNQPKKFTRSISDSQKYFQNS